MAKQVGKCQAWSGVVQLLDAADRDCASPTELLERIEAQQSAKPNWQQLARDAFEAQVQHLRAEIQSLFEASKRATDEAENKFGSEIARLGEQITRMEHPSVGVVMQWINCTFRTPSLRHRYHALQAEFNRATTPSRARLERAETELLELLRQPDLAVQRELARCENRLARLIAASQSPELAGATAELEVAELLVRGLQDEFVVFHNVKVSTDGWVLTGRNRRRSAQLDHVVVGPTGVFAIEVKRWSQGFIDGRDYHDPYEQAHAAAKLCHLVLTDAARKKIRVREVIATSGKLPPKPVDSYVRVLHPSALCGYVMHYGPELADAELQVICRTLAECCGDK